MKWNDHVSQKPVTILGAFFADLVCRTTRMPHWGETIRGESFATGPGGKGSNQAIAAARLGAKVSLITRVGRDAFGGMARDLYHAEGIHTGAVMVDDALPTGTATIIVHDSQGENAIIIVPGACDGIHKDDLDAAEKVIAASSCFVTQLELPVEICLYGIGLAVKHHVPVILNPAPAVMLPRHVYPMIDYLTPNESEAAALVGFALAGIDDVKQAARTLRGWGVRNVLITLGARGVYVCGESFDGHVPAFNAARVVDTTGAGDAFNGGLAAALAEGKSLSEATRFGCAVASLSVTRRGAAAAMPTRFEVDARLAI